MVLLKRQQLGTKTKPYRVPDNVRFLIDDFEDEQWSWRDEYFVLYPFTLLGWFRIKLPKVYKESLQV